MSETSLFGKQNDGRIMAWIQLAWLMEHQKVNKKKKRNTSIVVSYFLTRCIQANGWVSEQNATAGAGVAAVAVAAKALNRCELTNFDP